MNQRELGQSGLTVSELGLGCMSLPDDFQESKRIIDAALDAGITFFDTADLYDGGKNEELVGYALKNRREDIILATKVGNRLNPDGNGWSWNPTKRHIVSAVKDSLRRLGTDYIDLYQLHGGTMEDDAEETIEAFESLKKEGLIRHYGISSIRPTVIKRFLDGSSAVSVMMQYSLLDRRPEEWLPMIRDRGASVIARGTLAKGLLTDEGLARARKLDGFLDYDAAGLQQTIASLSTDRADLHAIAIAFALQDETVATALIGARTEEQLQDSIRAYQKPVDPQMMEAATQHVHANKYSEHRL
ncbi:aldo/keto reductase family oxidoreductase [Bacillus sp. OxB-1]|uniref:aldo/keto reductase n=1 Tax=Bacillus sp. (strain OxB-1) TaxID=98228 RepID=UPI0005820366|nr:aldo/keto reductase [Bacillus sp. OxB-1]BAQ10755.1 aldo/keto reductase family oxidoreductase [Bacillus sp. OxB-1]